MSEPILAPTSETVGDSSIFPYQLMPKLSDEEYQTLKEDIRRRGVMVPIELDENGWPLDGHHRLLIIGELEEETGAKIPYETFTRKGMTEEEKVDHVIALNLKRRHLTPQARAEIIAKLRASGKTITEIAAMANVGLATVGRDLNTPAAQAVLASAGPSHTVGKDGKVYPTTKIKYFKPTVMTNAEAERRELAELRKVERQIVPDNMPDLGNRYRTYVGNVQADPEAYGIAHGSADVIITDPPYPREYLQTYEWLAEFAKKALKPGGLCIAMAGHVYLNEVMALMDKHLSYHWTMACVLPGQHSAQIGRKVYVGWKPILIYVNGQFPPKAPMFYDVLDVNSRADKRFHEWGQDEENFAQLVERFSMPGQLVVEPFLGGGTTLIAALKLNRLCVGIDTDQEAVNTTLARIASVDWSQYSTTTSTQT